MGAGAGRCTTFEQPVEPPGVDRHHRLLAHFRLGVIGHRQACHAHHRQVVGAIADGDRLARVMPSSRAGLQQHALLFLAVTDVAPGLVDHSTGEPPLATSSTLLRVKSSAQLVAHAIGEEGTSSRPRTTRPCSRSGLRRTRASTSSPTARSAARATRTVSRPRWTASTSTTRARPWTAAATRTRCHASSARSAGGARCRPATWRSCARTPTGPIKVTVPGPFTMSQQAQDDYYGDPERLALAYAEAVNAEVQRPVRGRGRHRAARRAVPAGPPRAAREYGVKALNRALEGVDRHHRRAPLLRLRGDHPRAPGGLLVPARAGRLPVRPDLDRDRTVQPGLLGARPLDGKTIILGVLDLDDPTSSRPSRRRPGAAGAALRARRAARARPGLRDEVPAARVAFGKLAAMTEAASRLRAGPGYLAEDLSLGHAGRAQCCGDLWAGRSGVPAVRQRRRGAFGGRARGDGPRPGSGSSGWGTRDRRRDTSRRGISGRRRPDTSRRRDLPRRLLRRAFPRHRLGVPLGPAVV